MNNRRLAQKLSWIIAGVMALLPFHALITTWLGSNFGHLDGWRIWKELIIFGLAFPSGYLAVQDKKIRTWLKKDWLPRLIIVYVLLHFALGIWALKTGRVNNSALIYSWLINLRFLGFFTIVLVVSVKSSFLKKYWQKILLLPAGVVIIFGLLQRFVLPYDFLRHFGYGPKTIPAYQTVDNKLSYQRVQSTLRGANPLGSYLVLIIPALFFGLHKKPAFRYLALFGSLLVLFFSYSRSSWLGLLIAAGLFMYWSISKTRLKQVAIIVGVIFVLITAGTLSFRNNRTIQNTFFHTDNQSTSIDSSNEDRVAALETSSREVFREPLGRGPGTAGPASIRNNQPARIAENYYLQIGQEVGLVGLTLFLGINFLIAKTLWKLRDDNLAKLLLATLAGITFINLLSHAWTDDTLSLLWWDLAGIAMAASVKNSDILNEKRKHVQTS
ncbi:MAG TPA: O-antigen ligase family protein [Patescibacteria group bacterium]|nr:O-antigen ligase family protein [Patescibacteria group bacterium]